MVKKPLALPTKTLASQRAFNNKLRDLNPNWRVRNFPPIGEVYRQVRIAASVPGLTANDDQEFSSRYLTDWYVAEFCRLNNLKHG